MADDFLQRIKQARADAQRMAPAEAREYIGALQQNVAMLEHQAGQLEGFARQDADRVAARFGAAAGERQFQDAITGGVIAALKAEAAAIRALTDELRPLAVDADTRDNIERTGYQRGYDNGREITDSELQRARGEGYSEGHSDGRFSAIMGED